jgi:O-antigen ligase
MTEARLGYATRESFNLLATLCTLTALAILLVFFVTLEIFPDLGASVSENSGRESATYIVVSALAVLSLFLIYRRGALPYLWPGAAPVLILFAWTSVTVVYSLEPAASGRRLVLTMATYFLAAALPWLVSGMRQFALSLALTAWIVLFLCYFGIIFIPELSIHQKTDLLETSLAGDWRGIYGHKNITADVMTILIFFGWYLWRNMSGALGATIVIPALVFEFFSGGKSAMALLFAVAALALLVSRARSLTGKALLAFTPLAVLGFLTVGSVVSPLAADILQYLPVDATFTNRADVWRFAIKAAASFHWMGSGFESFWHGAAAQTGGDLSIAWAGQAHTSHNGYLDIILTIGAPGLVLVIIALLVVPLRDYHNTLQTGTNQSLASLFFLIWLYLMYHNMFEAFLLSRADTMWFTLALATCGLRYTARYDARP